MIIPKNIIEKALLKLAELPKKRHIELGMKATGDWLKSVEVKVENNKGYILANHYTEDLVHGRKPGEKPPISRLKRWAKAKFRVIEKRALRIAISVQKKIEREGTEYYKQGGTDLLEVLESKKAFEILESDIAYFMEIQIQEDLVRTLQKEFA